MKIAESSIQMGAQWSSVNRLLVSESTKMWDNRTGSGSFTNDGVLIDISEEGRTLQKNALVTEAQSTNDEEAPLLTDEEKEKISLIEDFVYLLTGKKMRFFLPKRIRLEQIDKLKELQKAEAARPVIIRPVRQGWGFDYQYHERIEQHERLSFASSGSVTTSDGREIQFDLSFQVSRDFISENHISMKAGDALLDPLVVNFSNASANLGARNYAFDLDMDGTKDTISFTNQGSGFLALDKNGNGSIDDGSELFGPASGNGFGELSVHDSDGNSWIDENDPIYEKLRIWTLDEAGDKTLLALGQAGVGAIYLGNVQTEFGLRTPANEATGQIRQTGIFLKESGEAGTIQHVDLVI